MRQIAYSGAVGCGYLFGTSGSQVSAAEWSLTPTYTSSSDYDSNRRLAVDGAGTESALVTADLRFERSQEDADFFIEPRYTVRRFSDSTLGDGDDRSLLTQLDRQTENTKLGLSASIADQSTLITELLETGIVRGDTHQRMFQAGGNWTWSHSERRQLVAQLSYFDVSYYGAGRVLLPGYRYPSGSLGERYSFSEKGSVTVSAYGSALSSDSPGNSSHEAGIEGEVVYAFSQDTRFDGKLGESSRLLSGVSSHGTDITASLTHDISLGHVDLSYMRNLVPYGTGFLVERKQFTLAASRQLTERIDASISAMRIDNDERAVLLRIDRRSYVSLIGGLNWHPSETWTFGAKIAALRTQAFATADVTVNEWRSSVSLTWSPHPYARSR